MSDPSPHVSQNSLFIFGFLKFENEIVNIVSNLSSVILSLSSPLVLL